MTVSIQRLPGVQRHFDSLCLCRCFQVYRAILTVSVQRLPGVQSHFDSLCAEVFQVVRGHFDSLCLYRGNFDSQYHSFMWMLQTKCCCMNSRCTEAVLTVSTALTTCFCLNCRCSMALSRCHHPLGVFAAPPSLPLWSLLLTP